MTIGKATPGRKRRQEINDSFAAAKLVTSGKAVPSIHKRKWYNTLGGKEFIGVLKFLGKFLVFMGALMGALYLLGNWVIVEYLM